MKPEDLAEQFASLTGFHEHAFWTFLEQGALAFHHADAVPFSYWRKRKNVPRKAASVDASSINHLEQNLSNYFHKMQGRGENCKVDCYNRNELDYFFAYPEDYAQARVEWVGKEFQRRPHHPAFEIIFVYSQNDGTLDIYLTGDRKPVPDLQAIFADTILKAELGPDEKDERVYDLNPVRSRQFQGSPRSQSSSSSQSNAACIASSAAPRLLRGCGEVAERLKAPHSKFGCWRISQSQAVAQRPGISTNRRSSIVLFPNASQRIG
jgi:hypothetical protein